MATKARKRKTKEPSPPRHKRGKPTGPVPKDSPKGRVAALMLSGELTFAEVAAKVRMEVANVRLHAKQLRDRGFDYAIAEDGKVMLNAKAQDILG